MAWNNNTRQSQAGAIWKCTASFLSPLKRYAVTELVESEREYVRDLKKLLDSYYKRLGRRSTPAVLKDKRDLIFSNVSDIMDFHNE